MEKREDMERTDYDSQNTGTPTSKSNPRIVALCYLQEADDEQNKCLLTETQLVVYYKGKPHHYPIEHLRQLTFRFKRLIFPLVFGGIIAPFSLMGMFTQYYYGSGWLLALFMVGLMAFNYGWRGKNTFTVALTFGEEHFFIKSITENMIAFSQYVNASLNTYDKRESMIYHITTQEHWQKHENLESYTHPSLRKEGFIHASTMQQIVPSWKKHFQQEPGLLLLVIDPVQAGSEIKYEPGGATEQLFPHVYGSIARKAIITVVPLQDDIHGNIILPALP